MHQRRVRCLRRLGGRVQYDRGVGGRRQPDRGGQADTGNVRDDLLACFEQKHQLLDELGALAVQALAAELLGPADSALRTLLRDQVLEPRLQAVLDILLCAAARGEIRPRRRRRFWPAPVRH
jgi:hypothetical protein